MNSACYDIAKHLTSTQAPPVGITHFTIKAQKIQTGPNGTTGFLQCHFILQMDTNFRSSGEHQEETTARQLPTPTTSISKRRCFSPEKKTWMWPCHWWWCKSKPMKSMFSQYTSTQWTATSSSPRRAPRTAGHHS